VGEGCHENERGDLKRRLVYGHIQRAKVRRSAPTDFNDLGEGKGAGEVRRKDVKAKGGRALFPREFRSMEREKCPIGGRQRKTHVDRKRERSVLGKTILAEPWRKLESIENKRRKKRLRRGRDGGRFQGLNLFILSRNQKCEKIVSGLQEESRKACAPTAELPKGRGR